MGRSRPFRAFCGLLFAFITVSVDAVLVSSLGGQAVYDAGLYTTWIANANLAASNTFGLNTGVSLGTHLSDSSGLNGNIDAEYTQTNAWPVRNGDVGAVTITASAQTLMFEEIAATSGIDYVGESWGGAWGDFDGDGLFDLWTSNHGEPASLYLNLGDGSFVDIAQQVLPADVWTYYHTTSGRYDSHGASWFDVDRDGDLDLFQAGDGSVRNQPSHLYINENGVNFGAEIGANAGIDAPNNPSLKPLILDWNNDGFADVFVTVGRNTALIDPMAFFEADSALPGAVFIDKTPIFPVSSDKPTVFGTVADLDGDQLLEIVTGPTPNFVSVFEFTSGVPADITVDLGLIGKNGLADAAVEDFDGDLDADIFAVLGENPRELVQVDATTIEATLSPMTAEESFSFVSPGEVTISIYPAWQFSNSNIYIGSTGYQPVENIVGNGRQFTLSPADVLNHGIAAHTPGVDLGHYFGFDPTTDTWTVVVSTPASASRNIVVTSTLPISGITTSGFEANGSARPDLYYVNQSGGFVDGALAAGFTLTSSARGVAAGDFDNDGDVDIYTVSTGAVMNRPNVLWLNDGTGFFVRANSHGAEGSTLGRGDSVSMADYDSDGFLDLFVTNGKSKPPFEIDGRYLLFHNLGNGNHWIELDLVGTFSEIQGIGATITVTAGGKSQRRMRGNVNTFRSQHMMRTHFGLGTATLIDQIHITWPSGIEQILQGVAVDQILTVTEPVLPLDTDNDGLSDALENSIGTDPLLNDTDGDNLSDFDEVNYDGNPASYNPVNDLNPLSTDTDGDGVQDDIDLSPHSDGDIAPLDSPDGTVNAGDYLIMQRIVLGLETATAISLEHGDLYPVGTPDGQIDLSDLLLMLPRIGLQ